LLCASAFHLPAQTPATPKPPIVNDPALKIELLASYPDVEACTTVCGAPDGSFYVGNDPRDGRLSNKEPVNIIVRFSGLGADRQRTVFADKIYSPAGSAWHDGYLYVLHDPLLTRFKDTNGDGIADVREDLVTNLGIPPNEGLNDHVVSGFTLGMDGFWYISVGDRGIYQAKSTKDGSTITMQGGGIARCRTDGTQLEIFSTGTRNHLQVNLDAEDNAFTRDNTDDGNGWWTRLTHHIEGGYYGYPYLYRGAPNYGVVQPSEQTLNAIKQHGGTATVDSGLVTVDGKTVPAPGSGQSTINFQPPTFLPAMADFGGGSPTGGLCYLSDGLPQQYRGRHFFSEWGKAGVFVTEVARDGATFKLVSDTKLIEPDKGGDFRPMQLSVAADGSLLIADWGYGGWKSPRIAGAIWRLSWPEAKPAPRLKDESKATVEELTAALGHSDRDQRLRAEYALVGKGEGGFEKLAVLVQDKRSPSVPRIHALWTLENIATLAFTAANREPSVGKTTTTPPSLERVCALAAGLLEDHDATVRAQAARLLGSRAEARTTVGNVPRSVGTDFAHPALLAALKDPDPHVRRQAASALGHVFVTEPGAGEALVALLLDRDPWVRFAARGAALFYSTDAFVRILAGNDPAAKEAVWLALENAQLVGGGWVDPDTFKVLVDQSVSKDAAARARAIAVLGRVAYDKSWDGHWWGTQPVKAPPPPNSSSWSIGSGSEEAGTTQALKVLTAALSDADTGVRLAAAKAFTGFILDAAGKDAGAALRARLTAESDAVIRRQLIESLGVQKDPQAMDVFRQIALDEKADAEFRETAIGAVVSIGGDAAKKTIAQLADAKLSPAATRKIITAAGELKVLETAPALIAHLKDADAGNREFSVKSLQQLGPKSNAGAALIEVLSDKDGKVQAAAIEALGSFREKAALPALIALAEKKKSMKETIGALANMPDESAIPVLVETLRDKNTSVRRNAIKALKSMREKAWPQVEALLASGRVPEELVPEIRSAFESGAITKWKMVGVFENVWDAVHPPEKEALANGGAADLSAKYHNAEGKDVSWIDVAADADAGRVDLEKVFKSNAMVCAYAFTEIDASEAADAKLFSSADDELAIWVNGKQVLNQAGSHGYEPDKNETPVPLAAGKNQLLVKIGNKSGSWVFHARMPGFENGKYVKSKEPAPDEKQRAFALAANPDGSYVNAGNAANGAKIFADPTGPLGGICATCHVVNGKGGQVGPDLSTVAANYKRPDLITSLHEPSKTIALGFEQFVVETKGGDVFAGAVRQETTDALTLVGVDAQPHVVKKADLKTRTAVAASLMPPGLTLGLKPEEFTDLLAYLETLRGK
jgi:putative membrane-bound dehydrogenase-like protein